MQCFRTIDTDRLSSLESLHFSFLEEDAEEQFSLKDALGLQVVAYLQQLVRVERVKVLLGRSRTTVTVSFEARALMGQHHLLRLA